MNRLAWIPICIGGLLGLGACAGLGRVTPYDLGVELQDQGRFASAIEHYQEVLAEHPEHLRARFNLAVIYHDQKRYDAAKREYRRLLHDHPQHARSLINLADIADAEGDAARAYVLLLRAVDAAPEQAYPYSYLGRYLQRHGRRHQARAAYERALAIEEDSLTHYRLGTLWLELDRPADAMAAFTRAVDLDPDNSNALYQLAALSMKAGRHAEAERYLQRLTQLTPHEAEIFVWLGQIYLKRGQYATAALHFWEARDLQPDATDIEHLLLVVYQKLLERQQTIVTRGRTRPSAPAAYVTPDGVTPQAPVN